MPRLTAISWNGWRNSIHFGLILRSSVCAHACANETKNGISERLSANRRRRPGAVKAVRIRHCKGWIFPPPALHVRSRGAQWLAPWNCSRTLKVSVRVRGAGAAEHAGNLNFPNLPRRRGTAPMIGARYRGIRDNLACRYLGVEYSRCEQYCVVESDYFPRRDDRWGSKRVSSGSCAELQCQTGIGMTG